MQKVFNILLIISIFFAGGLAKNKIYFYHILLAMQICWIIYDLKSLYFSKNKVIISFIIFTVFCFQSSYITSLSLALKNLIYIFIGFSIIKNIKYLLNYDKKLFFKIANYIINLTLVIGILESLGLFRWFNSIYETSIKIPSVFYGNINNFATFLIIIFPFYLIGIKKRKILVINIVVILYLLFVCDSRANNIALIIEVIILSLIYIKNSKKFLWKFLIILSFFAIFYLFKEEIFKIFEVLIKLKNIDSSRVIDSVSVRKVLISNILDELRKKYIFILGVGGGNSIFIHIRNNNTEGILANHSFYLQVLVEYGIIIFLIFIYNYYKLIQKNYIKSKNPLNLAIVVSLIGYLFGSNSMSNGIYFFPFYILLGIASFYSNK